VARGGPCRAKEHGMYQLEKIGQDKAGSLVRGRAPRTDWMRRTLERCQPFSALDAAAFERLLSLCAPVRFARRGMLYEQGSRADSLYVLAAGRVREVRVASDNRSLTVAYRLPGELLGETALPEGHSYQGTASAIEPVDAAKLPMRAVTDLLFDSPAFANCMIGLLVHRRLEAEGRIASLLSRSVESRVAEFLVDAARRNGLSEARGVLIGMRYTHQEIADYVGSTRETVTLTLGDMRRQSLLCFDHRRIVITDAAGLAKLV
jgi:CRP/FNR family cyclic AMP-dependent transcriptional regulator